MLVAVVAKKTMLHGDVRLAADDDVVVLLLQVREKVQGEDYGAVGGVFEGDDAAVGAAFLYGGEDIFDGDDGGEGEVLLGEGVEGGLRRLARAQH